MDYQERRRFFIVNPGRTGSTLLAAILADAGANFCFETPESWDPTTGGMEHEEIRAACYHFRKAYEISQGRPSFALTKYLWDIHRHYGKKHLKAVLDKAHYVKADNLDLAVQPAFQLGFFPCVILNFRNFEDHARSASVRSGHATVAPLVHYYNRVIRNGMLMLHLYGGCAVGYEELVDPARTEWVSAVSQVTGLPREALLTSHVKRVSIRTEVPPECPAIDTAAAASFSAAQQVAGRAIEPSPQALQHWHRKWRQPVADAIGNG